LQGGTITSETPTLPPDKNANRRAAKALIGTTIQNRYHVVRLLGDGGMGAVYKAADTVLRRFVAVKLLHAVTAENPSAVERFVREARSSAAIGHPNIIDVLDFGYEGKRPYLVMEYLRGRSLSEAIHEEKQLSVARACNIATHSLAGLGAAHDRGILHRDIKPANMMLIALLGDRDFVKLCDFGFAALIQPSVRIDGGKSSLTPTRTLVGTPAYAAPERLKGDDRRDPRLDVWSIGVVLFEMLAGRRPFDASTFRELARKVRKEPAPSLCSIRNDVPRGLDAVVQKALAKKREGRFSSAAEFAAALVPFGGRVIPDFADAGSDSFTMDLLRLRARETQRRSAIDAATGRPVEDLDALRERFRAERATDSETTPEPDSPKFARKMETVPRPRLGGQPARVPPKRTANDRIAATSPVAPPPLAEVRRRTERPMKPRTHGDARPQVTRREEPHRELPRRESPRREAPRRELPKEARQEAPREAKREHHERLPRVSAPRMPSQRAKDFPMHDGGAAEATRLGTAFDGALGRTKSVRGSLPLAVLRFVSRRFGERALTDLLLTLPNPAHEVFGSGIVAESWIRYEDHNTLMGHIDATLGRDDLHLVVQCGRAAAESAFDRMRAVRPPAPPPQELMRAMPVVLKDFYRGIVGRVTGVGRGFARFEIEEVGESSLVGSVFLIGFLDRSLDRFGAKEVEVNLSSTPALGDDECVYDISWLA
jgi:serine/threonine protein kinase